MPDIVTSALVQATVKSPSARCRTPIQSQNSPRSGLFFLMRVYCIAEFLAIQSHVEAVTRVHPSSTKFSVRTVVKEKEAAQKVISSALIGRAEIFASRLYIYKHDSIVSRGLRSRLGIITFSGKLSHVWISRCPLMCQDWRFWLRLFTTSADE